MKRKVYIVVVVFLLFIPLFSIAQNYNLRFNVLDTQGQPVYMALIQLEPSKLWTMTDRDGVAVITNVKPSSKVESYKVSILGYKELTASYEVKYPQTVCEVILEEESFAVKEVVVVAENSKSDGSTSSKIGSQAIEHLQATSLKDVLQLLPGQVAMTNPSLTSAGYLSLRTLNDVNSNNSFGASVMIDGIPVSTNADMGVSMSSLAPSDKGVDLRSIGTDDISSIEIIRGIASVEYGDMSSGAMIVNSKYGISDFKIKGKILPGIYQAYVGKGLDLGKFGCLNVSADYAYGKTDPRYQDDVYMRGLANIIHTKTFWDNRYAITTKLSYSGIRDWSGADPAEHESLQKYFKQRNTHQFTFSHSGKLNLNLLLARNIKYDLAFSYKNDKFFCLNQVSRSSGDNFHNAEEGMFEGLNYPNSFEANYGTRSVPISYFFKINDNFNLDFGPMKNKFVLGFELRSEGNEGKGRFDNSGIFKYYALDRYQAFNELKYLTQISAYAEDKFSFRFSKADYPKLDGSVGLRWTMIQPGMKETKNSFSPRINLSLDIVRQFSIRGAWGLSDKMPSLRMLYPEIFYYDFINSSVSQGSNTYMLYSTKLFNVENLALVPMRNMKSELGFDIRLDNGMSFSVVSYYEKIKNGFGTDLNQWASASFPVWKSPEISFDGTKWNYDLDNPSFVEDILINISTPSNTYIQTNWGVEYDFNLGKIRATNTSFYLNGAWSQSSTSSNNYLYTLPVGEAKQYSSVYVVYPKGSGGNDKQKKFSSALRIVQHIPAIRFIVSATAQFVFYQYSYSSTTGTIPIGYIKSSGSYGGSDESGSVVVDGSGIGGSVVIDGSGIGGSVVIGGRSIGGIGAVGGSGVIGGGIEYVAFSEDQLQSGDYVFEGYQLKDQIFDLKTLNKEIEWPTLWSLNLRVTKEINSYLGFSFFVNNVFFHQPWQSSSYSTNQVERNSSLFSYGLEMNISF